MPATPTVVDAEAAFLADATEAPELVELLTVTPYFRNRPRGVKAADLRKTSTVERRVSVGRVERIHTFEIRVQWPITAGTKRLDEDQRYLEHALDLLCARIRNTVGDHTHGGLFLSVAEDELGQGGDAAGITVTFADPDVSEDATGQLVATVGYAATAMHVTA